MEAARTKDPSVRFYPIRIALHETREKHEDHLDCFIDAGPEQERLVTYRAAKESIALFQEFLSSCLSYKERLRFVLCDTSDSSEPGLTIELKKAQAHRRIYMDFSGALGNGRGVLLHVCRGLLERSLREDSEPLWPDKIFLNCRKK